MSPDTFFAGNHCSCSKGIFSFWFHVIKSVPFCPGADQSFSINTSCGLSSQLVQSRECAHVPLAQGGLPRWEMDLGGEIWSVLLALLLTVTLL